MTGLTFNGVRVFSDKDVEQCWDISNSLYVSDPSKVYDDCIEDVWRTAMQDAHDEWWDATQYPEQVLLHDAEAVKHKWLPRAA